MSITARILKREIYDLREPCKIEGSLLFLMIRLGPDEVNKGSKEKGVEVGHDDKAESGNNKTPELDTAIRRNTTGKIIRKLAIEEDKSPATDED